MHEINHPDRLFPVNGDQRKLARNLYETIKDLPIISPHGHTDPTWFHTNQNFANATSLLLTPDHYLLRMFYSQGIDLETMGRGLDSDSQAMELAWKTFASHLHLFWGTPSWIWLNHVFSEVFGLKEELNGENAMNFYHEINRQLGTDEFKPNALLERFNIELIATTDDAIDELHQHTHKKVIPTFRPDRLTDPEHEDFASHMETLSVQTGENVSLVKGYLNALKMRREFFKTKGTTATDHGHATAWTLNLSENQLQALLDKALKSSLTPSEAEQFRAAMLVEMAKMSLDDGLVMQIHPGSHRNHNHYLFQKFGRDVGADIPQSTEYTHALKDLLNTVGNEKDMKLIIFTLDESRYSSELAPLAGHYPALKLGPAWWFHDSFEGMMRFRERTMETAGFYNTVGFNDDTRAFFSIPARHDVARRVDCHFISKLVLEHRLTEKAAFKLIQDLTYHLPKKAYNL
ncbi:MAG: glucuronate isomerase [Halobacteriovoraceae bacterium]|nr:glucuronate isomerase [Halobacteriovoraceae bacterium]|tara:strand:+ start:19153 stop:20532 length:1380 start_codon:yes stop_codon:yes gene_type:complete